jgi:hypothetical protein
MSWQRLIGTWRRRDRIRCSPGEEVRGTSHFEWLGDGRFIVWRSHYEHPKIPDGVILIGVADEPSPMHYFDERGVRRVYVTSLDGDTWRYWREASAPDFSQRYTGTFAADGNSIAGHGELSRDGSTWEGDLDLNYRRVSR